MRVRVQVQALVRARELVLELALVPAPETRPLLGLAVGAPEDIGNRVVPCRESSSMGLGSYRIGAHNASILGGKATPDMVARRAPPGGGAWAVERDDADPFVTAAVGGSGDEGAFDRGGSTGAWRQLRVRLGIVRRMDSDLHRTVERRDWRHGGGKLVDLMGSGHFGAGKEGHVQEGMRQRLGQMSCLEHTPPVVVQAAPVATGVLQGRADKHTPPSPRCRGNLEKAVGGSESHRTREDRVREPYAGALGLGGPKRSGNRGASGYGAMSLVERLNQTVSIHPDMTDAPTHYHSPHSHGCSHAPPTSPPRPTENPSRADLGGQSRC